jgi:hypothetical protein
MEGELQTVLAAGMKKISLLSIMVIEVKCCQDSTCRHFFDNARGGLFAF